MKVAGLNDLVAAGFVPAFKFQIRFLFDLERGRKARGYEPDYERIRE